MDFLYNSGIHDLSMWILFSLLASLCAPVLRILLSRWKSYLAFKSAQRCYGCQKPRSYPHADVLGLDLIRQREQAVLRGASVQHYDELFDKLGRTWEERALEKRIINTIYPRNIQHIVATGIDDFRKLGQKSSFRTLLGSGIFLSNGQKWKFSRELIKPIFAKAEISDLSSFSSHASRFMALLPRDGSSFDIQPLIKRIFLDSSTEFLFGQSMFSLLPNNEHIADELLADLHLAISGINRRILSWSRFQHIFDRSFPKAVSRIHAFIDQHVEHALKITSRQHLDQRGEKTSGCFVLLHEMAKQVRDPVQLRFEILNIFMASRDTISTLTANCLFQLARHPQCWEQLRTLSVTLSDEQCLSYEILKSLRPFRNAIFETFRTIGPTGKATRIAVKDTILPSGGGDDGTAPIFVAKGDFVVIPNNSLHHDKVIWGDEALTFHPGRWDERRVGTWEFIPFLGGPRICPANQMVIVQTTYLLVKLTRNFVRLENRDCVHEYVEEAQLLLTESRNGVVVGLIPPEMTD